MLEENDINRIALAVVKLLDENRYIAKKEKKAKVESKRIIGTDTYKKNYAILDELKTKEFIKSEYDFVTPPYNWKYIINKGKGIFPEKYIVALYWREKQKYTALRDQYGYTFEFETSDVAMAQYARDIVFAKKLADCVEFKDIPRLIEIVNDKAYDERLYTYGWEWKISTLIKYINLL